MIKTAYPDAMEFSTDVLGLTPTPVQALILLVCSGAGLDRKQRDLFADLFGVEYPGPGAPDTMLALCGRQCGKSTHLAAPLAIHKAFDPRSVEGLKVGERRYVVAVSPTVRQTQILYRRITALITGSPMLASHVERMTTHEIELRTGITIAVWVSRGVNLRGLQIAMLIGDEFCFLPQEGSRADIELLEASAPGMAHCPVAQTFLISTPWVQSGEGWEMWRHRAQLAPHTLVAQASSQTVYPDFPLHVIERATERDPEYAKREYGAEFGAAYATYLPAEAIDSCVVSGRTLLPPVSGQSYSAAVDLGFKQDRTVVAIAHREDDVIVVDFMRTWNPPVRLEQVLPDLETEFRAYGIQVVRGDQFSSEAFRTLLQERGLSYQEKTFSQRSKMTMYQSLKDAIVSQRIELLDNTVALRELRALEARALPGGGVRIEAPRGAGQHDDHCDVLAILSHELRPTAWDGPAHVGVPGVERVPSVDEMVSHTLDATNEIGELKRTGSRAPSW